MKWLALALLLLNLALWQLGELRRPGAQAEAVASGHLPRVASLRVPEGGNDELLQFLPGEQACVRIGWFPSTEIASSLAERFAPDPVAAFSIEKIDRPLPSLHWVIIPPQPPAVALEQFREMQNQGVDSYLVTEGENKNAISLGLFESREAAMSVLEEKKRKNLNAVLVNFDRNQLSYALSFETEPDLVQGLVQAVEADFGSAMEFVEVKRCEGVATPDENP